jgi:glycosyltransferase 2 family protein
MTTPSHTSAHAPHVVSATARPGAVERAAGVTGVANEAEERAVNLKDRFFNFRTGFSFLLGVAILVALFRFTNVDPGEIVARFRQMDWRFFILAVLSYVCTFPFRGLRWQVLLRNIGVRLPLAPLTEVIFISWFVNSIVPGKLGDIYRGYLIKREYRLSLSRTVGTVLAERIVDLLCLILILGTSGFLVLRNRVSPELDSMLHLGWIGFVVLIAGMMVMYRYGERLMSFAPERFREAYARFAQGTFSAFRNLPIVGGLTLLAWGR